MSSLRWLLVTTALASCRTASPPCAGPVCGAAQECLANRCVAAGSDPVPAGAARIVREPMAIAVVGASGGVQAASVNLGGERGGSARLYLRFEPTWRAEGEVVAAFLLLEPSPGVEPNPDDLPLDVWTVAEPWSPERARRGARPRLTLPRATGIVRSSPSTAARIDVTEVVRSMADRKHDSGIAVLAASTRGRGATLLTGSGGGAPRLELYVRPRRRPGAAW